MSTYWLICTCRLSALQKDKFRHWHKDLERLPRADHPSINMVIENIVTITCEIKVKKLLEIVTKYVQCCGPAIEAMKNGRPRTRTELVVFAGDHNKLAASKTKMAPNGSKGWLYAVADTTTGEVVAHKFVSGTSMSEAAPVNATLKQIPADKKYMYLDNVPQVQNPEDTPMIRGLMDVAGLQGVKQVGCQPCPHPLLQSCIMIIMRSPCKYKLYFCGL